MDTRQDLIGTQVQRRVGEDVCLSLLNEMIEPKSYEKDASVRSYLKADHMLNYPFDAF